MPIRERIQQGRAFPSLASEAIISLAVAAEHLDQVTESVCQRHGLTADQYNVLRILRGVYPEGHPRCEVARRMIHRSPDVTRMLDRLCRQGIVSRTRNPDDRRESIATITRTGLALLERVDPDLEQAHAELTAPLSEPELRRLSRLCDALVP
jgi:MarR family transcriptional regulator, 2-MHQ and catechol-resistance regulon repressor